MILSKKRLLLNCSCVFLKSSTVLDAQNVFPYAPLISKKLTGKREFISFPRNSNLVTLFLGIVPTVVCVEPCSVFELNIFDFLLFRSSESFQKFFRTRYALLSHFNPASKLSFLVSDWLTCYIVRLMLV